MPSLLKKSFGLLPVFALVLLWACSLNDSNGDQYLTWDLSESYKDYDSVAINLVDTKDTTLVYEQVWNAKIPDPAHFPKYRLTKAKGKDFTIQIRCYNAKHELLLAKDIKVVGVTPSGSIVVMADLRLFDLTSSSGALTPPFTPGVFAYTAQVGDSVASINLSASPIDAGNTLTINGKPAAWSEGIAQALVSGANVIDFLVKSKDGQNSSHPYELVVTRGRVILPEEVTSVSVEKKNLLLYTGDGSTALKATVVPAGALMQWKSLNEAVVRVDGNGNLTGAGPGATKVIVKAGNLEDTAAVVVKTDAPVVDVGQNLAVKVNTEVTFAVSVHQDYGTMVSFKYDLDGDGTWDNSGSDTVTVPTVLKHTYTVAKTYIAHFYAKDGEGNETTVTRTITVDDAAVFQLSIVYPGRDTVVNVTPFTVKYEVNGTSHSRDVQLKEGLNPVTIDTGSGADKASASVNITLDTQPPNPPKVTGTSPTNTTPKWFWSTGGGGGTGDYRYKLDDSVLTTGATDTRDTALAFAGTPASGKTYTLYVAEKDALGNWSKPGKLAILFDATKPAVAIASPQASGTFLTTNPNVALSGTASGPNPIVKVSYKINSIAAADAVFDKGAWTIAAVPVTEGSVFLVTVIATDNVGNTGEASLSILRDNTPPTAPVLSSSPGTPTQSGKGSWSWTAGGDGTTGSGLNGKYRYALNGATFTETPSTTVSDLIFIEGANSFAVQEQDLAGNWSASVLGTVLVDRVGPKIDITSHKSPASLTSSHVTLSGTVSDSGGSGLLSVVVTGQISGSGTATITGGTWTTGDLVLKSGANTLVVTATDKVGNSTNASLVANVNVADPVVTITYPAVGTFTNKDTISVKYKVDGGAETVKAFASLTEGSNVLTITSLPNELGNTGTKSITVIKDATPPNAPTINSTRATIHQDPTWTWTSNGDNAGGSGTTVPAAYQVIVNGGTPIAVSTASYTVTGAAEGVYSLVVREQDKAGNWSANSNAVAITVDKTAPVITITSPTNAFITNQSSITITYTESGSLTAGTKFKVFNSLLDFGAANSLALVSDSDAAGNITTKSITAYRRSNVVFVNAAGTVTADGSTWDNGYRTIQAAMTATSAKEIWVAAGSYLSDSAGFSLLTADSLYGGFDPATAKALTDRVPFNAATKTVLHNPKGSVIFLNGNAAYIHDVTLDGFDIPNEFNFGTTIYSTGVTGFSIVNCNLSGGTVGSTTYYAIYADLSTFTCTGVKFADFNTGSGYEITATGTGLNSLGLPYSATFKNCDFTSDKSGFSDHLMDFNLNTLSITNSRFTGALRNGNVHIFSENVSGAVTVTGNTFKSASQAASIKTNGTNNTFTPPANSYTP